MSMRFANHRVELAQSLLDGDEKIRTRMHGTHEEIAAGEVLIEAGSDYEYVHRLKSGWACRTRRSLDEREQYILVYLPGELFGLKSMFVAHQYDDVILLTDALVERVHQRDLHHAFMTDADVAHRCVWQIVEEERRLHVWVFALARAQAEERLAWALLDFRNRLAACNVIGPDAATYPLPLTQAQLACHLGITPIHLNRILQRFRHEGLLRLERGQVTIPELDRLADFAFALVDDYRLWSPGGTPGDPPRPPFQGSRQ